MILYTRKFFAGKAVSEKWRHIRDAFALSLRKKSGDKRGKKYLYHDQLQFLTKIVTKDNTVSSIDDDKETEEFDEVETDDANFNVTPKSTPCRPKKQKTTMCETDMAILKALEATALPQPTSIIDEDAGFFASITPAVKKFNDDQKLMFRMRVLALIQEIKNQSISSGPPSNAPSTSSYSSYDTRHHYGSPEYTDDSTFMHL